jgi:GNAT superfamily N-acetyltransferase
MTGVIVWEAAYDRVVRPASDELTLVWDAFVGLASSFYTPGLGGEALGAPGWFAALSHEQSGELNVCGLTPPATDASAKALLDAIGPDLPAIVFVSSYADPAAGAVLEQNGFAAASVSEPLMRSSSPPQPAATPFRIEPADAAAIDVAVALTADAHHVDREMVENTIRHAGVSGTARVWIAWDGSEPISVIWIGHRDSWLGVMEMMTPERHQRRGAGRALMTRALAQEWSADTESAVLIATPAGRRLYESIGFVAVDEILTRHRGLEDEVLDAIGQPG